MKVTATIRRSDVALFTALVTPRVRSTYVGVAVLMIFIFVALLWLKGVPTSTRGWIAIAAGSLGGSVAGMVVGLLISLATVLLSSTAASGLIGEHEYEIRPDGLAERTAVNDGVNKWGGIQAVHRLGPFICFRISGYLYHLIPRRSFENDVQFHAFYDAALRAWKGAA